MASKIAPAAALGAAAQRRGALSAEGVLALQAAAGNRAVAGLVQARRDRPSTDDSAGVHEAAKDPQGSMAAREEPVSGARSTNGGGGATLQLMRRNPPRKRRRTAFSLLRERMTAGADRYSFAGGTAMGAAVATLAAANAWNPLGWGVGAGLLAAAGLSYLRGRSNADREADRRFGLDGYQDDQDPDWEPSRVASSRMARARAGGGSYPLETASRDWDGTTQTMDAGSGPFSFHRGRGRQPYVTTRATDFGGAKVDSDYDSLVKALSDHDPEVEESRGFALSEMARGCDHDVRHEPPEVRRAMTSLLGITQVAEEHSSRTPGSAAVARASFRSIADGASTFHEQFNRKNGHFVAARRGGTAQMREVSQGGRELEDTLAGNISDDDDD